MPSPVSRFLLIPALPDFVARYPQIRLVKENADGSALYELVP